jgi:hypothetical protein
MKNNNSVFVFVALFVLVLLSRWSAHTWNFTLVGGAFLFAGAYFQDKKISLALMLSSMLVTDYIIGFYSGMLVVYLAYALIVGLGYLLTVQSKRLKILGFSILGSFLFFVITNFAVWYSGILYPMTAEGLIQCFTMAIPFYRTQMLSDLIFAFTFFEVAKVLVKHNVLVFKKTT